MSCIRGICLVSQNVFKTLPKEDALDRMLYPQAPKDNSAVAKLPISQQRMQ